MTTSPDFMFLPPDFMGVGVGWVIADRFGIYFETQKTLLK
jgi:hypothetical protein